MIYKLCQRLVTFWGFCRFQRSRQLLRTPLWLWLRRTQGKVTHGTCQSWRTRGFHGQVKAQEFTQQELLNLQQFSVLTSSSETKEKQRFLLKAEIKRVCNLRFIYLPIVVLWLGRTKWNTFDMLFRFISFSFLIYIYIFKLGWSYKSKINLFYFYRCWHYTKSRITALFDPSSIR